MFASGRLIALQLLFTALAFSQAQINSGDLKGSVMDGSGGAIRDAAVTVTDTGRGITRTGSTNEDGEYRIPLLPSGNYKVRVEAPGFTPKVFENVEVRVGDTVVLMVQMVVSQVTTEILVQADIQVVETERTQQANTIQSQQIRNLPINRRNYLDLALLTPGVVETTSLVDGQDFRVVQAPTSGLSFGGSNGRGNAFTIDGAENYINSGGVRPSISQEAVGEFQVNRNGYTAEVGNAFGGAVNIVSRSGTNEFHGNFFGFLRHRNIQARNYFDPGKSAFTRQQSGATFGGPLVKDRTFFFLGFERLDRQETTFVPILQDRGVFNRLTGGQQQLIDFFNASGVPQLRGLAVAMGQALTPANYPNTVRLFNANSGNFPYSEDDTKFSVRLDHRFTEKHNMFFRGNLTRSTSNNALLGALLAYNRGRDIAQNDYTTVLTDTYIVNNRFVIDSRLMFAHYTLDVTTIDKNGPQIDITGFGNFGREIFLPSKIIERHYQFQQNFTYASGRHNLKFGYDLNPVRDNVRSETFFSGRFSFGENVPLANVLVAATGDPNLPAFLQQTLTALGQQRLVPNLAQPISSLQAYNLGLPTFYQQGFGDPNWLGWSRRWNFFLQDTWRLNSRLTLNLGVRYELENNPPAVGTDPNNFSPRVGLAWTPTADGKTAVRAGYGIFFSQNNLQIANVAESLAGTQIAQVFVPLSGLPGFNNPLTGRPLTSGDIFGTLARQGVIGSRQIQASDLRQFGIVPNPNLPFAVIFGIDKDWRNPYSQQASFEIERAFGGFAVSAAYNFNRAARLPRILNRNLQYGPRRPDGQPTYTFVNPLIFQRNIFEATSNSFYHAALFQVNKRFSRRWSMNAHYTFSKAIDETTDFNTDYAPHDQLNARGDRALSPYHQAHRLVASAVLESPAQNPLFRNFLLSPILTANSGRPFNVLSGVDNLGDRTVNTHRPLRAGRNIGKGPNFYSFDLRLSRRFQIGPKETRNLEFIAEGFNMLNRTNFRSINNVVGDITVEQLPQPLRGVRGVPTSPLSFTSAFEPRQFQFAVKFNY